MHIPWLISIMPRGTSFFNSCTAQTINIKKSFWRSALFFSYGCFLIDLHNAERNQLLQQLYRSFCVEIQVRTYRLYFLKRLVFIFNRYTYIKIRIGLCLSYFTHIYNRNIFYFETREGDKILPDGLQGVKEHTYMCTYTIHLYIKILKVIWKSLISSRVSE